MTIQPATQWGYDPNSNQFYRDKNGTRVHYTIGDRIGKGSFSTVSVLLPDKEGYKCKAVKISSFFKDLKNEFDIHSSLGRNYVGIQKLPKFHYQSTIVMSEYQGDLETLLPYLTVNMRRSAIDQLIKAIKVLHDNDISHNDIRLPNILCNINGNKVICHISDFGVSEKNNDGKLEDIRFLGAVIYKILLIIPQGLSEWLWDLSTLMMNRYPSLDTVLAIYNENTHQDNLCFFK